ncbi:MAG: hypothetical protein P1P93_12090 [Gammaproteobacteria bacterium]|nr:hypothetical protein [Gammaproteobacteria bacterium]
MMMQQVNFYQTQFRPQQIVLPVPKVIMVTVFTIVTLLVFSVYFSQKITAQTTIISQQQHRVNASQNQLAELQQQLANLGSDQLLIAQYTVLQQQLNTQKSLYTQTSSKCRFELLKIIVDCTSK